jgi:SAM-dependent methyltransferase
MPVVEPMRTFVSGLPETACGYGSTLEATEAVRGGLRRMLDTLGVKSLIDAPCGDGNWIKEIDLTDIVYSGMDLSANNVELAREAALPAWQHDILREDLPYADAILCRDFLQHLPTPQVVRALKNFRHSGALWLIATCYENDLNDDIAEVGEFRPLNLMASPFDFPAPYLRIDENPTRPPHFLGAWRL